MHMLVSGPKRRDEDDRGGEKSRERGKEVRARKGEALDATPGFDPELQPVFATTIYFVINVYLRRGD
jgi:hypothetical protein